MWMRMPEKVRRTIQNELDGLSQTRRESEGQTKYVWAPIAGLWRITSLNARFLRFCVDNSVPTHIGGHKIKIPGEPSDALATSPSSGSTSSKLRLDEEALLDKVTELSLDRVSWSCSGSWSSSQVVSRSPSPSRVSSHS